MSGFTSEGVVKNIGTPIKVAEKLTVQDVVIEIPDKYPQLVLFQFKNDRTDQLRDVRVGDILRVSWNLRGREYQGRYFTTLEGWKVERSQSAPQQQSNAPAW